MWLLPILKWSAIVAAIESLIYLAIRWIHELRCKVALKRGQNYKMVVLDGKEKLATKAAMLKAVEAAALVSLLFVLTF